MLIHFTRDSVCVGDDYFDSSRDYEFALNDTWDKIMFIRRKLIRRILLLITVISIAVVPLQVFAASDDISNANEQYSLNTQNYN